MVSRSKASKFYRIERQYEGSAWSEVDSGVRETCKDSAHQLANDLYDEQDTTGLFLGMALTAARHDGFVQHLRDAGLRALADLGFLGANDDAGEEAVVTGFKATRYRKLTAGQKEANRVLAAGRAPVEHGFAHLKNWRILTKLRTDPARATGLLRALLVLTSLEVAR